MSSQLDEARRIANRVLVLAGVGNGMNVQNVDGNNQQHMSSTGSAPESKDEDSEMSESAGGREPGMSLNINFTSERSRHELCELLETLSQVYD